jgi:hypothetical protein
VTEEDLAAKASEMIDRACTAMQQHWPAHTVATSLPLADSHTESQAMLMHHGHGLTGNWEWACGLVPQQPRGEELPSSGPFWQVANALGRWVLARGNTEAEAIENARPMFASNVIYVGPGLPAAPDPAFAQVGMRAFRLRATP